MPLPSPTLPDFTREPLVVPAQILPLPGQQSLIPDFEEITMAAKTADKPKTPRKKVTVQKPPADTADRDGMLLEACGGQQSKIRWGKLRSGSHCRGC